MGSELNALAYLSMRAALDRAALDEVTLHFDTPALADTPLVRDLADRARFQAVPLDVRAFAEQDLAQPGGLSERTWERLVHVDGLLKRPAFRSDLLRMEVLWLEGGIYLDTDAVVLRDLQPLLADRAFVGVEQICFPMKVKGGYNPLRWMQGAALTTLRASLNAVVKHPGLVFQRIAPVYFHEPMNAVCGAIPRHPAWRGLLEHAASFSDAEVQRPYRVGPWLTQELLSDAATSGVRLHPPEAFYAFPPEVSVDYIRPDADGRLGDTPHPDAYIAHLWDSVMTAKLGHAVGPADLQQFRHTTLLGRLCEPYLDDLFALTA